MVHTRVFNRTKHKSVCRVDPKYRREHSSTAMPIPGLNINSRKCREASACESPTAAAVATDNILTKRLRSGREACDESYEEVF